MHNRSNGLVYSDGYQTPGPLTIRERKRGRGGGGLVPGTQQRFSMYVCVCVCWHTYTKKGGKNERRKKKGRIRSSSFEREAINFRNLLYLFLGMKHMICHFLVVFFE